jgi:hypothetical protein
MTQRQYRIDWAILAICLAILSCSQQEQAKLETQIAEGATMVAKGLTEAPPKLTQAAQFVETAALVATQGGELVQTGVAVATSLADKEPSPWDTSWLPRDSQAVAQRIDNILSGTGLDGQGSFILETSIELGVNPAFALAMFKKEAEFAKPTSLAHENNNPGNIKATGNCRGLPDGSSCNGYYGEIGTNKQFGVYSSMEDGLRAYFALLSAEYKPGTKRNCNDIACIINAYAPPSENITSNYIDQMIAWTPEYQNQLLGVQP